LIVEFAGPGTGGAIAARGPDHAARELTLFDGTAWTDAGSAFITPAAAQELALDSERIHGAHHYVHVDGSGRTIAAADPLASLPLFVAETPDWTALSGRAGILRALLGGDRLDPRAAMWLSCIGYRVGDATHTPGVTRLPPNSSVCIDPGGRLEIREGDDPWGERDPRPLKTRLRDYRTQVAAACRLALDAHGELDLGLTGGKDSRLMLAILYEAGLHRDVTFTCMDFAADLGGSADARVAAMLAEHFDLNLHIDPRPMPSVAPLDPETFFARLANHAAITDGLAGFYDPATAGPAAARPRLVGMYGEALKHANRRTAPLTADLSVTQFLSLDPYGALNAEAAELMRTAAATEMRRHSHGARLPGDPGRVFYITQRLTNWAGAIAPVLRVTLGYFFPLYNLDLLALPFQVDVETRRSMWFHHEIIAGVSEEMAGVPFANDAWADTLRAPVPKVEDPPGMQAHGSWQSSVNHSNELRRAVTDQIADAGAVWWDWLDRATVLEILESGRDLTQQQIVGLYGLLAFAQWRRQPHPQAKLRYPAPAAAAGG